MFLTLEVHHLPRPEQSQEMYGERLCAVRYALGVQSVVADIHQSRARVPQGLALGREGVSARQACGQHRCTHHGITAQ